MSSNPNADQCPFSVLQEDDEVIGFASLPEQVHRKALKRGFDFTLMVVGESGLGKSTLVQSLFLNNELYSDRKLDVVQGKMRNILYMVVIVIKLSIYQLLILI